MITVSIAEDLPEIRSRIEKLITEQTDMLLLSSSSNAEEAIPAIINSQPDVVIMDINMPGKNGIDCIRAIKNDCPTTRFMIFTIYENDEKYLMHWPQAPVVISLKKHLLKKYWNQLKN